MSHYEWQVIRKSAGVWTTIGTYLDVLPRSEVRIRRRRVTVHHGAWEEVA